jgi:hypothetical protein
VVGEAPSVLERASDLKGELLSRRAAVLVALVAGLTVYYAAVESLPELPTWWDVATLAFLVIPALFALVYLVLPLWRAQGLFLLALALGALAVVLASAGLEVAANFVKAAAVTSAGFWFLRYFENLGWVVLVAALVPGIDAVSVWRGPTQHIVSEQREVFTALSIAFPIPGEHASANLGLPDVLFFALFLAATVRFGLRTAWTWVAMTLSFGATMALAVASDAAGLPALPGLCIAFLGVNADLIWPRLRTRPEPEPP